jgi:hypothetical protein
LKVRAVFSISHTAVALGISGSVITVTLESCGRPPGEIHGRDRQ